MTIYIPQTSYFGILDIIPIFLWLAIIFVTSYAIRNSKKELHYNYYLPNLYAKVGLSVIYGIFYLFIVGGGDTQAYFDGAVVLTKLLVKDPPAYFEQMMTAHDPTMNHYFYDSTTGLPPGWIFREPEGFFVAKIMSIIALLTLRSYFAMTLVMAWISALASWKLYELIRSFGLNNDRMLAFGVLLMPSINFWCAGVSKDTVVFIASCFLVYHVFHIVSKEKQSGWKNYAYAILAGIIIYKIRAFILAAIMIPVLFSVGARVVRSMGGGDFAVIAVRTILLVVGLAIGGVTLLNTPQEEFIESSSMLQEAAVIQGDFASNQTYGDKRYDIGTIEFSPIGLIRIAPMAILAGMYRPFVWEALNATLIINGLESIIFIYFTFLFLKERVLYKWRKIRGNEFLIFCLVFMLIIAYMTGLTSGLYGVLVRLRSPLLPFLFVLLTIDYQKLEEKEAETAKELAET